MHGATAQSFGTSKPQINPSQLALIDWPPINYCEGIETKGDEVTFEASNIELKTPHQHRRLKTLEPIGIMVWCLRNGRDIVFGRLDHGDPEIPQQSESAST
ncbi:unnamed protein product [Phytophthora fragariaefolia]|uniref:Unnamed protein product n=1 Tax=Phytophthora fragariaefolia TaxID=1490495 RepID=A0A9W7D3I5_9STRA|nr:unnamed protein product [Phytophthora fragariaefolia]